MLMKPFQTTNKIKVEHLPIESSVGCCEVGQLVKMLIQIDPKQVLMSSYMAKKLGSKAIVLESGQTVEISSGSGQQLVG